MNLWKILKNVGTGIIGNLPGGNAILSVVNELLPSNKKVLSSDSGDQIYDRIKSLTSEQQSFLLAKEFDVEIEQIKQSYDALQTMLKVDATCKQSTRPKIAYQSFLVIAFAIIAAISAWAVAVITRNSEMIKSIENSWMFIAMLLLPLVTVLHAYFGVIKQEHQDKHNAAMGHKIDPISGLLSKLFKK